MGRVEDIRGTDGLFQVCSWIYDFFFLLLLLLDEIFIIDLESLSIHAVLAC